MIISKLMIKRFFPLSISLSTVGWEILLGKPMRFFPEKVKKSTTHRPGWIKAGLWYSLNSLPKFSASTFKQWIFRPKPYFSELWQRLETGWLGRKHVWPKFCQNEMKTRSKRLRSIWLGESLCPTSTFANGHHRKSESDKPQITYTIGNMIRLVTGENLKTLSAKQSNISSHHASVGHGHW